MKMSTQDNSVLKRCLQIFLISCLCFEQERLLKSLTQLLCRLCTTHTHTQKTSSKYHNLISSWNRQQCHAHTVLTWSCIRRWLTITVAFLQVFVHWKLVLRSDLTKEAIQKLSDDNFLLWLIWRQAITHIPGVTRFLQETHLCSCHLTELQPPILHWTVLMFQSGKHISPELSVFLE